MRLLSNFFQLVVSPKASAEPKALATPMSDTLQAMLATVPSHPIYQAHFPGYPVTPGVLLVQVAVELASSMWQQELTLSEVKNVKYLAVLNPNDHPTVAVVISRTPMPQGVRLNAQFSDGDTVFAKMSLHCKSPLES